MASPPAGGGVAGTPAVVGITDSWLAAAVDGTADVVTATDVVEADPVAVAVVAAVVVTTWKLQGRARLGGAVQFPSTSDEFIKRHISASHVVDTRL